MDELQVSAPMSAESRKRTHSPSPSDHGDKITAENATHSGSDDNDKMIDVGDTTLTAPSPKRARLAIVEKGGGVDDSGNVDEKEWKNEDDQGDDLDGYNPKGRRGATKKKNQAGKKRVTSKKTPARVKTHTATPDEVFAALLAEEDSPVRRSGRVRARTPSKSVAACNTSAEATPGPEATVVSKTGPKSKNSKTEPKGKAQDKAKAESKAKPKGKAKAESKTQKKATAEPQPKKLTKKELWQPENLATRFSPFALGDLSRLLNPKVLNRKNLTDEEYDSLIALLPAEDIIYPANSDVTVPDGKPIINPVVFDDSFFMEGVCNYQEDLCQGKYEPEYLAKAADARKRRLAGEFDSWKEENFEVFWGEKQKLYTEAIAGESSKIKLAEMIKTSVFKIGDVFSMRRHFTGGLVIRKDAILEAMGKEEGTLNFSYPPGTAEWHTDDVPDKIIKNVMSLQALETLLCKENGTGPERLPNGNAWKTIRIVRKGEDIGCIFDQRVKYYNDYYNGV